jgi:hypothetical protein
MRALLVRPRRPGASWQGQASAGAVGGGEGDEFTVRQHDRVAAGSGDRVEHGLRPGEVLRGWREHAAEWLTCLLGASFELAGSDDVLAGVGRGKASCAVAITSPGYFWAPGNSPAIAMPDATCRLAMIHRGRVSRDQQGRYIGMSGKSLPLSYSGQIRIMLAGAVNVHASFGAIPILVRCFRAHCGHCMT